MKRIATGRGLLSPCRIFFVSFFDFLVAKAVGDVVVYHPSGLHEGVADSGAEEFEATLFHRLSKGRCCLGD